jgi:hypothetical protein
MKQNQLPRIAIVYLAIGKYDVFWSEFYNTCEQYLFLDATKFYFVFTDSPDLLSLQLKNVAMIPFENKGWAVNVIAKSWCMLQIREQLQAFDYMFYINANYKIHSPIYSWEILPDKENDYLAILSFDHLYTSDTSRYAYDRNSQCLAYIPYGEGTYYYQGGFYGGRISEMLSLAEYCETNSQIDLSKGIMALWQDESYLNKYLLNLTPKVIKTCYCMSEEFYGECKAMLRDKNRVFGEKAVDHLKMIYVNPDLSYLYDKKLQLKPLHLVEVLGRLGNQMFQYAFLLSLQFKNAKQNYSLYKSPLFKDPRNNGCCLEDVFVKLSNDFASEELENQIKKTPSTLCHIILEKSDSNQVIDTDWKFVTFYSGYWQSELYFKDIEPKIREAFHFDTTKLNEK